MLPCQVFNNKLNIQVFECLNILKVFKPFAILSYYRCSENAINFIGAPLYSTMATLIPFMGGLLASVDLALGD